MAAQTLQSPLLAHCQTMLRCRHRQVTCCLECWHHQAAQGAFSWRPLLLPPLPAGTPLPGGTVGEQLTTEKSSSGYYGFFALVAVAAAGGSYYHKKKKGFYPWQKPGDAKQPTMTRPPPPPGAARSRRHHHHLLHRLRPPLPSDWTPQLDPATQKTYYYNTKTGATQWVPPNTESV